MIVRYDQDSIEDWILDSTPGGRARCGNRSVQGCCQPGGHLKSFHSIHTLIGTLFRCRSVSLRVLSELQTQFPRGPEESHLDRPFRGIENLAHTLQLEALKMPQVKNHALSRRKFLQSLQDVRA